MRYLLSLRGVEALFIAAIGMAVVALTVAVSAAGLHSAAQLAQRVTIAIGFMGASSFAFWAGMTMKGARDEARRLVPVPVSVRVRGRRSPSR